MKIKKEAKEAKKEQLTKRKKFSKDAIMILVKIKYMSRTYMLQKEVKQNIYQMRII